MFFQAKQVPRVVEKFLIDAFRNTVNDRKEKNTQRNDFLELLMQLMDKGYKPSDEALKNGQEDGRATLLWLGASNL